MNFFTELLRRAQKRRAYADMKRLDDHLLRDIGVTRTDIDQMMNGSRTTHGRGFRTHE